MLQQWIGYILMIEEVLIDACSFLTKLPLSMLLVQLGCTEKLDLKCIKTGQ